MCKFATRPTVFCLFGIASIFGSIAQAAELPTGVSQEELFFLFQIGVINDADLDQFFPLPKQSRTKASGVTQEQWRTLGLSGTDLESGRIRGLFGTISKRVRIHDSPLLVLNSARRPVQGSSCRIANFRGNPSLKTTLTFSPCKYRRNKLLPDSLTVVSSRHTYLVDEQCSWFVWMHISNASGHANHLTVNDGHNNYICRVTQVLVQQSRTDWMVEDIGVHVVKQRHSRLSDLKDVD